MKNSKCSQVSTKKVIFEAKKIVSTTFQTRLNIFFSIPHGSQTRESKTEDNAVGMESLSHLVFFYLARNISKIVKMENRDKAL